MRFGKLVRTILIVLLAAGPGTLGTPAPASLYVRELRLAMVSSEVLE